MNDLAQPDLNFSGQVVYGRVRTAEVNYSQFLAFCRHRRVLMVIAKNDTGIYRVQFRNPVPEPPDLLPWAELVPESAES